MQFENIHRDRERERERLVSLKLALEGWRDGVVIYMYILLLAEK